MWLVMYTSAACPFYLLSFDDPVKKNCGCYPVIVVLCVFLLLLLFSFSFFVITTFSVLFFSLLVICVLHFFVVNSACAEAFGSYQFFFLNPLLSGVKVTVHERADIISPKI